MRRKLVLSSNNFNFAERDGERVRVHALHAILTGAFKSVADKAHHVSFYAIMSNRIPILVLDFDDNFDFVFYFAHVRYIYEEYCESVK